MTKHLTRQQLLRAIKSLKTEYKLHLESCIECQEQYKLLKEYVPDGQLLIHEVPQYLVERAGEIMQGKAVVSKIKEIIAKLSFDSWEIATQGVRSVATSSERRVHFEIEDESLNIEMRFEQQRDEWNIFATITVKDKPANSILIIDKKELSADESGFYQWSGKRSPRKISIKLDGKIIELPELKWK